MKLDVILVVVWCASMSTLCGCRTTAPRIGPSHADSSRHLNTQCAISHRTSRKTPRKLAKKDQTGCSAQRKRQRPCEEPSGNDGEGSEEDSCGDVFPEEFRCAVCLELSFKPVVLPCGHLFCFWCCHTAMNAFGVESSCPICRNPYQHFPPVCAPLHSFLYRKYASWYKKRFNETDLNPYDNSHNSCSLNASDTRYNSFEPHLDVSKLNSANLGLENEKPAKSFTEKGTPCTEGDNKAKQHTSEIPRRASSNTTTSSGVKRHNFSSHADNCSKDISDVNRNGYVGPTVHIGVGCDACGMMPIVGKRFRILSIAFVSERCGSHGESMCSVDLHASSCQECRQDPGFDLCEQCFVKNCTNFQCRFKQMHMVTHHMKETAPNAVCTVLNALRDPRTGSLKRVVQELDRDLNS